MDFPAAPVHPETAPPEVLQGLGITPTYVGENDWNFLIEVESESILRGLKPDFGLLGTLPNLGFIVTSIAESDDYDFVSRFFAPSAGINEDPVTGSAHCALGPYWQTKLGKDELVGYQASARGGVVRVRVVEDRVKLQGQAVTVMKGELS